MASFLGRGVENVSGELVGPLPDVLSDATAGVSGRFTTILGERPRRQAVTVQELANSRALAETARDALLAKIGDIGTVVTSGGETVDNVAVLDAVPQGNRLAAISPIATPVGYGKPAATHEVVIAFSVEVR